MTQNNLVGKTILVVEDQFTILLDLKGALEEAGGRVLLGSEHVEHAQLSAAVLDRAEPIVADRLTERGLPFVFYTGRQSNEFARWPHIPILVKPASVTRIVSSLADLLHPQQTTGAAVAPIEASITPQDLLATEVLMQDSDHRVKNTIQSIASLLDVQARACTIPEARAALEEARRRLGIFARVHELLHNNGAGDRAVDLADVIQTLADALRATFSDRVRLRVAAAHVLVESRLAIPLALLVNEAVTNAYKHAYPNGQSGDIFVRIANQADRSVTIAIRDDGVGFTPDVREGALGLSLMRSFSSQLGGELAVLSDKGTSIQLTVPDGALHDQTVQEVAGNVKSADQPVLPQSHRR
jgi:two-component sensor histidine kinase